MVYPMAVAFENENFFLFLAHELPSAQCLPHTKAMSMAFQDLHINYNYVHYKGKPLIRAIHDDQLFTVEIYGAFRSI